MFVPPVAPFVLSAFHSTDTQTHSDEPGTEVPCHPEIQIHYPTPSCNSVSSSSLYYRHLSYMRSLKCSTPKTSYVRTQQPSHILQPIGLVWQRSLCVCACACAHQTPPVLRIYAHSLTPYFMDVERKRVTQHTTKGVAVFSTLCQAKQPFICACTHTFIYFTQNKGRTLWRCCRHRCRRSCLAMRPCDGRKPFQFQSMFDRIRTARIDAHTCEHITPERGPAVSYVHTIASIWSTYLFAPSIESHRLRVLRV